MVTRAAVSAAVVLLFAAGCAGNNSDPAASPATPPSSPVVVDPSRPSTEPSSNNPTQGGARTISGTVTRGVEAKCLLLEDGGTSYSLIFDDPAVRAQVAVGQEATLSGRAEPAMMSTCQQGVPFLVTGVGGS